MKLNYNTFEEASKNFSFKESWEALSGTKENLNIAYECVDRHDPQKTAIRIKFADGSRKEYSFEELSRFSSQIANYLKRSGIKKGDRIVLLLFPSIEFYASFFGIMKAGAVVVPCFPLFGEDAIEFRVSDSNAQAIIITRDMAGILKKDLVPRFIYADDLLDVIKNEDDKCATDTSANDLAVVQYSSGTTGKPKAIEYKHIAVTLTAVNTKFGIGIVDGDTYFNPSSPAWGHGIWYGTVGPLIFGTAIGVYSGKFSVERLLEALEEFKITNLSATPLVFLKVMTSGIYENYNIKLRECSYTGGPIDIDTLKFFRDKAGHLPRSIYGSTEVGALMIEYPFPDWEPKLGSLGMPMIGVKVAVIDENDNELPPGKRGDMAVLRKGKWVRVGDSAYMDEDGYFWHKGRSDDIIISAGYTIGPFEIEEVLERHPHIERVAVIGVPDNERGEIVKAVVIPKIDPSEELKKDIQEFVKTRLSKHEYPREIEFVKELPCTPDGKIKRNELKRMDKEKKGLV